MSALRGRFPLRLRALLAAALIAAASPSALAEGGPPAPGPVPAAPAANPKIAKGYDLLDEGDVEGALREFESAAKETPSSAEAHVAVIEIWIEAGDHPKATTVARTALEKCPGDPGILTALGRALLASRQIGDAQVAAEQALMSPSAPAAAWRLRAWWTSSRASAGGCGGAACCT